MMMRRYYTQLGIGRFFLLWTVTLAYGIIKRAAQPSSLFLHVLTVLYDQFYFIFAVLPILLFFCASVMEDDAETLIFRYGKYSRYFAAKWKSLGILCSGLWLGQMAMLFLTGLGLPFTANRWDNGSGSSLSQDIVSLLAEHFSAPWTAALCAAGFLLVGYWLVGLLVLWLGHFLSRSHAIKVLLVLYVLSIFSAKLPIMSRPPFCYWTGLNHWVLLLHNLTDRWRFPLTLIVTALFVAAVFCTIRNGLSFRISALHLCPLLWQQTTHKKRRLTMHPIIELHQVRKSFSRKTVLQDVSLTVEAGHTVGIVGSNGSGKSVLFQIICGFLAPDSGVVQVRGKTLGNDRDFPENIGVLINSPGFISLDTGLQNLRYLAGIRGIIGEQEIRNAMKKVGLDPEDRTRVEHYSLGMKQKLGLAQAIMEGQDILILDEPFNALDYKTYHDVKELIRVLQAEGKTILLTSHHYEDIKILCDEVYVLEDGCLTTLPTKEMKRRFG